MKETSEDMEALARRAVACPAWRWMPRMGYRFSSGPEVHTVSNDGLADILGGLQGEPVPPLPDLSDPATLGCLLALVREAWGKADLYPYPVSGAGWVVGPRFVGGVGWSPLGLGPTEAAALVAALEAAPKVTQ